MVDCSIPQIAGLTVQNILFNPSLNVFSFWKHILIFFTVLPSKNAKTGSTSSAFSCGRCASCLCLMKNQVLEPWKDKPCGFPSYLRLSATATATATVAPTIGLLPIEIRRFIRQKPIALFCFCPLFERFLHLSVSFFIPTFFITLLLFFSGWQMVDNSQLLSQLPLFIVNHQHRLI